jgi:hypothetical protein
LCDLFLVRFWAFLGKGSSKTPYKYFYKKYMSKSFSEQIGGKIDVYRVFGCFSAMGIQKYYKKRCAQKKTCRKAFTKKSTKNPKPVFLDYFLNHVFGRFGVREFKNTNGSCLACPLGGGGALARSGILARPLSPKRMSKSPCPPPIQLSAGHGADDDRHVLRSLHRALRA